MRLNGFCMKYALFFLIVSSCSDKHQDTTSSVSDVSMPRGANGQEILLWIDGGKVFLGSCAAGVPRRATCQQNVVSKPTTEVTTLANTNAQTELNNLNAKKTTEIARIKAQDPTVVALTAQIREVRSEESRLTTEIRDVQTTLSAETAKKKELEELSAWYEAQIAKINAQLARSPDDRALLQLREDMHREKEATDADVQALTASITLSTSRLQQANDRLSEAKLQISSLDAELKSHLEALVLDSDVLTDLNAQIARATSGKEKIAAVLTKIENTDITYRNSVLSASEKLALVYLTSGWGGSGLLKAGRYKVVSGYMSYCPQSITPTVVNNVLTKVKVYFLSPCSGSYDLACNQGTCQYSGVSIKPKSETTYEFKSGSYQPGMFAFQSALGSENLSEHAPETVVAQ